MNNTTLFVTTLADGNSGHRHGARVQPRHGRGHVRLHHDHRPERTPAGVALFGNDLFVANSGSHQGGRVRRDDGGRHQREFRSWAPLKDPEGLAILGNRLLVVNGNDTTVSAYGIPATRHERQHADQLDRELPRRPAQRADLPRRRHRRARAVHLGAAGRGRRGPGRRDPAPPDALGLNHSRLARRGAVRYNGPRPCRFDTRFRSCHETSAALAALAAALLALAPGRAAADPAAVFVGNFNASSSTVPAYSVTGAVATGYAVPRRLLGPGWRRVQPRQQHALRRRHHRQQLRTFNATTGVETTTATGFAAATGLSSPLGLTLNAGVLYAANDGGTITAYNAATGARITAGFTSPAGLNQPSAVAVAGNTLYVLAHGNGTLGAYNLATGAAVPGFTPLTGLGNSFGLTLSGTTSS